MKLLVLNLLEYPTGVIVNNRSVAHKVNRIIEIPSLLLGDSSNQNIIGGAITATAWNDQSIASKLYPGFNRYTLASFPFFVLYLHKGLGYTGKASATTDKLIERCP